MLLSIIHSNSQITSNLEVLKNSQMTQYQWINISGPNVSSIRNYGVSLSKAEWILFLDGDCEINITSVLDYIYRLKSRNPQVSALSGVYSKISTDFINQAYNQIQRSWMLTGIYNKKNNMQIGNRFLGGTFLIKREVFIKTKGFNEKIGWGGEEIDFSKQLRDLGIPIYISYRLRSKHHTELNWRGYLRRAWIQNKNKSKYNLNQISKINFNFKLKPVHMSFILVGLCGKLVGKYHR